MSPVLPRVIVAEMRPRVLLAFLAPPASAAILLACGDRSGLLLPAEALVDGGPRGRDAAAPPPLDASADAPGDAPGLDALPPIDVTPPPPDAPNPCPDAGATLIYVISQMNDLFSFYPPTAQFTRIGTIQCPSLPRSTPFSMAVDRNGIAFVVFTSGELFRVSTATASCAPTGFVMNQGGFSSTFGMGFSRDPNGVTETLYLAGDPGASLFGSPSILGGVDPQTLQLRTVGTFSPSIFAPELTGTGAGDLFAFYAPNPGDSSHTAVGQIDENTARVLAETPLPGVTLSEGWAFAFWGGDFYFFTAPSGSSIVTRFRPSDDSIVQVGSTSDIIVGAGVSTCAPQQ